jgi:hypothetical protein
MRKLFTPFMFTLMILMLPFSLISGQEKKTEKKIKVVIDDGSGKKVLVDTVFKDSQGPDSITIKDGTVIYLKHPNDRHGFRYHIGKENKEEFDEITVISSDSAIMKMSADSGKVYFYSNSEAGDRNGSSEHRKYRVIKHKSGDGSDQVETIYVNKGKSSDSDGNNTFDVYVSDNDREREVDKTRIVIAKDGMVITIEGNDEAKTKEMAEEIKDKMGIKREATTKQETISNESKKALKK